MATYTCAGIMTAIGLAIHDIYQRDGISLANKPADQ